MIYFQLSQILVRPNDVLVKDPRIVSLGEKSLMSLVLKSGMLSHKM